ncbi:MAG: DUF4340 domain-containing protein [Bacteroidota bacterium]|nr:DUF4340 domain-containing protein [Bacteroidota bacterium]
MTAVKNKKKLIPIVIAVLLASISFWLIINNKKGTISEEMRAFAVKDTASITKIFLADKKGRTITLERKSTSEWTVNKDFSARPDAIQTLLETIARIDVKEPVSKKAHVNVIKKLSAVAVKCEIFQGEELLKAYYIGSETQDNTGTYAILIDNETMEPVEKPFVTYIPGFEGYLTSRYFVEEQGWRDRSVFRYNPNNIKSVRMEVPYNPEFGYELTVKGNNDYEIKTISTQQQITDIDPLAVKQYLSYFQNLNFESFEVELSKEQSDSVMRSKPINILTVTDMNGKKNQVKFYARRPKHEGTVDEKGKPIIFDRERMDAVLNNGKDFVMLQYFVFGKVMPQATYFQKKPNG